MRLLKSKSYLYFIPNTCNWFITLLQVQSVHWPKGDMVLCQWYQCHNSKWRKCKEKCTSGMQGCSPLRTLSNRRSSEDRGCHHQHGPYGTNAWTKRGDVKVKLKEVLSICQAVHRWGLSQTGGAAKIEIATTNTDHTGPINDFKFWVTPLPAESTGTSCTVTTATTTIPIQEIHPTRWWIWHYCYLKSLSVIYLPFELVFLLWLKNTLLIQLTTHGWVYGQLLLHYMYECIILWLASVVRLW
jgi:hypothetical protein